MHHTGLQRGERKCRAAFEKQAVDAECAELAHQVGKVYALVFRFAFENVYTVPFQFSGALISTDDRDIGRDFVRRLYDSAVDRRSCAAVADYADRIAPAVNAAGEQRIVLKHGADADHDGGQPVARFVHMTAGGLAGNPAAVAGVCGDFAVQRHRVFHHDKWGLGRNVMEEHLVYGVAFVFQNTGNTRNTGVAQNAQTLSGNERVWIQTADNDTGNFVFENRIGARRGASPVAAWLQRHIHSTVLQPPVPQFSAGFIDSQYLCMGQRVFLPVSFIISSGNDFILIHDHTADGRLFSSIRPLCLLDRLSHINLILRHNFPPVT